MTEHDGGIIRWEDPPDVEPARRSRPWALVAHQLRHRPGQWALIDDQSNTWIQPRIVSGRGHWWKPRGAYESVTRTLNGRIYTYARYVG